MKAIPNTLAVLIESAINRYLALDSTAEAAMSALAGKTIEIRLRDVGIYFYLCSSEGRINVAKQVDGDVQSTMTATVLSLARQGLLDNDIDSMFSGDVEITGDTALGQAFRDTLKNVQIDWEEILSTYTGDIVAHQVGNSIRSFLRWGKNTAQLLGQDAAEYLQQESRHLPAEVETQWFLKAVDELRMDVDRAEARVKRLLSGEHALVTKRPHSEHSESAKKHRRDAKPTAETDNE